MSRLLLFASLLFALSACSLERDVPPAVAGPVDSTFRAAGLSTGRVKFNGPVTFQIGGSGNNASSTAIAKAKGAVASAPRATATETTTRAGTPWYVFVGLVLVGVLGGAWLRGKFSFLSFLK